MTANICVPQRSHRWISTDWRLIRDRLFFLRFLDRDPVPDATTTAGSSGEPAVLLTPSPPVGSAQLVRVR
jgi:hypothetical protein